MNRDQFLSQWNEIKGKVKQKWGKLTDQDIAAVHGKFDELSAKIQQRYGFAKEHADREIISWCAACDKECRSCDHRGGEVSPHLKSGQQAQKDLHKHQFDKKRKAG